MEIKGKTFYGWWIIIVCFITLIFGHGVGAYCFGLFLKPLSKEFEWSRAAVSFAYSLWGIMGALAGPLIGKGTDRYGSKSMMICGALCTSVSLILLSQLKSLWQMYLLFLLWGMGFVGVSMIPNSAAVSLWFKKRRGTAMGIVFIGMGLGGVFIIPLTNYLILNFGFRAAFLSLGIIVPTLIIPPVVLIMKNKPEEMGLSPDGEEMESVGVKKNVPQEGFTSLEALKTLSFWLMGAAFILYSTSFIAILAHLVAFATDQGFSQNEAALAYTVATAVSMVGRLGFGYLSDIFPKRYTAMATFLLMAGAMLLFLQSNTLWILYFGVIAYGLGYGGIAVVKPLLVGEYFGLRSFGIIFGYLQITVYGGSAIGPLLAGYIFDVTRNYDLAFILFFCFLMLATICLLFCKIPAASILNSSQRYLKF